MMELLMLGAGPGTVIELSARGPQAAEAITALASLIECKFDET
jgi:phosphocarrier protein HPr